ncbi:hypothetical protein J6590_013161 [Homalodisca vitripennis]|nr:hypothetical protein J6590_013161 [Homalodisca vitripennis]
MDSFIITIRHQTSDSRRERDVEREKKRGLTSPSTFLTNQSVATSPLNNKTQRDAPKHKHRAAKHQQEIDQAVKVGAAVGVVKLLLLPPPYAQEMFAQVAFNAAHL